VFNTKREVPSLSLKAGLKRNKELIYKTLNKDASNNSMVTLKTQLKEDSVESLKGSDCEDSPNRLHNLLSIEAQAVSISSKPVKEIPTIYIPPVTKCFKIKM